MKHTSIIAAMSEEEKVSFLSGSNMWQTTALPQHGIPSVTMCDGPHGLRKQATLEAEIAANAPLNMDSTKATCFPTAALAGCSWDRELLQEVGRAIALEALSQDVKIVLGPGVNIKRNPLCGRNFEYFSEDPYLSGQMGTAWIQGCQETGVMACAKHFAANSQEFARMLNNSIVDVATLHELYLPAFEACVKEGKVASIMCAYNKLNGVYCSDNVYLLQEVLRGMWGFDGIVMTDWYATNDRAASIKAGLNLEMPNSKGYFDKQMLALMSRGKMDTYKLHEVIANLIEFVLRASGAEKPAQPVSLAAHHALAARVAAESAVLLKNQDATLPLTAGNSLAIIGAMAKTPHYQGGGSSHVNAAMETNVLQALEQADIRYSFCEGYTMDGKPNDQLIAKAVAEAKHAEQVVVFAGLTDAIESEGFDREDMQMPQNQNDLIEAIARQHKNVVVVLFGGAPVEMPWLPHVQAVLHMYLPGQACGVAAVSLLMGKANPCGKLAETIPLAYADVPHGEQYATSMRQSEYREGLFVGYRYYDKADTAVQFAFGHGLSYTQFEYRDVTVSLPEMFDIDTQTVNFALTNIGAVAGAEVTQVYVRPHAKIPGRPLKTLCGFQKKFLQPGQSCQISIILSPHAFHFFDAAEGIWKAYSGKYDVLVGSSSQDIRLVATVDMQGIDAPTKTPLSGTWYDHLHGEITDEDFAALLGTPVPPVDAPSKGSYTTQHALAEINHGFIISRIVSTIQKRAQAMLGDGNEQFAKIMNAMLMQQPLKTLTMMMPEQFTPNFTQGLLHIANGNPIKGLLMLRKLK